MKAAAPAAEADTLAQEIDMQVFISAGMPEGALRLLFKQAMAYPAGRVRFVLRGFEPQKIGPLITKLRDLMPDRETDHILIDIDPNAFRDYGVRAVPVYVVRDGDAWFEVRGAQSLAMAEENVKKRAHDVQGELYDIQEPDILAVIEDRVRNYDWQTVMVRAQQRAMQHFKPGFDLPTAARNGVQYLEPSFTLTSDVTIPDDGEGREVVLGQAGESFNLLDHTTLDVPLIVFDPDDSRQLRMVEAWLATDDYRAADVFVVGSHMTALDAKTPATLALARRLGRPVYPWLPQLSERMGVRAVPTIVRQVGHSLQVATYAPKGIR